MFFSLLPLYFLDASQKYPIKLISNITRTAPISLSLALVALGPCDHGPCGVRGGALGAAGVELGSVWDGTGLRLGRGLGCITTGLKLFW